LGYWVCVSIRGASCDTGPIARVGVSIEVGVDWTFSDTHSAEGIGKVRRKAANLASSVLYGTKVATRTSCFASLRNRVGKGVIGTYRNTRSGSIVCVSVAGS